MIAKSLSNSSRNLILACLFVAVGLVSCSDSGSSRQCASGEVSCSAGCCLVCDAHDQCGACEVCAVGLCQRSASCIGSNTTFTIEGRLAGPSSPKLVNQQFTIQLRSDTFAQ